MNGRAVAGRRGLPASAGIAVPSDRRFRRPDIRPGKRRRLSVLAVRFGAVALGLAMLLAIASWAVSAALRSRVLAINHVLVRGNVRLSNGEVEALIDGIRGQSLLLVDLGQYRKRLMDSPWVAGVTLWRVLPSTVEIRIVERTPMAVARLGQQLYLVDREGVIIDGFGPQYRDFDLPIVDGLVPAPTADGPAVARERVVLTGRLLDALEARPDLRQRLSQVDVSDPHDAVVLLDTDAALLHLGDARFVERLRTYFELAPTLHERLPAIDYVDLRFDELVYVRSRGQSTAIATGTKK
jgi:cell division protein FtsQ